MDADDMYSEMLLYLQGNCSYGGLKDAAGELYNAVHGAYEEQAGNVSAALKNTIVGNAFDAIVDRDLAGAQISRTLFSRRMTFRN